MRLAALLSIALAGSLATAHEFKAGNLEINHPWARATPGGSTTGAVYFKIKNSGAADTLVSVNSNGVAEKAELHTHLNENGVMKMQQVAQVTVPAKGTVLFGPGSFHVMLFGMKRPLIAGEKVPMTLHFSKAGDVKVEVKIEPIDVNAEALYHSH